MAYELLTVLLGGCAGAALMVYLASRGSTGQVKSPSTAYAPTPEPAPVVTAEAPAITAEAPAAEPAPAPAPAAGLYEMVQPAPAPVTYAAPSTTSFGAPTLAKKPTRTYRRRTAPVRSAAGSKKTLAAKKQKR
jgi:hypothetical protein